MEIQKKRLQLQIKTIVTIDWTKVNAWTDPNEYQYKREQEYPLMQDQLDDIYHNGIDGWKKTIKTIKDKYPKE